MPCVETLSSAQKMVLHAVLRGEDVFVTGRAGCGKSDAVRCMIKCLEAAGTSFAVAAPTGIAAEQVGGVTIHSLVSLNEDLEIETCIERAKKYKKKELSALQVLIIDEVSMLSEETFVKVLRILRAVRVQLPLLVLVGDFLQLPPIKGTLLLESPTWKELKPSVVLLTDCFRQDSASFLKALDEARMGSLSPESIELLKSRVNAADMPEGDVKPTVLFSKRAGVDELNYRNLAALPDATREFVAKVYHGSRVETVWEEADDMCDANPGSVRGLEKVTVRLPCVRDAWMEAASFVSSSSMIPVLKLALRSQVVFVANVQPPLIVNGTRGVITAFTDDGRPIVKLVNGRTIIVSPWQRTRRLLKSSAMPCLVYEQYPLQLAWALTIHKSQGMTLDLAQLDIGRDVFSDGQAYVALSRLRDISGMSLLSFEPSSVRANAVVVEWYRRMEEVAAAAAAAAMAVAV